MSADRAPVIFEISTAAWLRSLASDPDRAPVGLGDVTRKAWDAVLPPGIDTVWLMGVWQRSPAGVAIARGDAGLRADFRAALPNVEDADIVGSPYCIQAYRVEPGLGGDTGLAAARAELARRGLRLILDYVPNHVAPDHAWATAHPEYFVRGNEDDLHEHPDAFLRVSGQVLARGRDPYFPPWPDVVQLNAFSPELRRATTNTLSAIGDRADGVRCDMAMLMRNEVFARTWGARAGEAPDADFWPEVITAVRERHADMLFLAEAYWDLEWALQQDGFDYCYDKRLYDRLVHDGAELVRAHLGAGLDYQRRLVRFIENHDEPRAAAMMDPGHERAAAVTIATLPGATLWHQGQPEGWRVHLPVFLDRWPAEPADTDLAAFHRHLLAAVRDDGLRDGHWSLLSITGWPDNDSCRNLLGWAWDDGDAHHLVIVNLSPQASQGRVALPWDGLGGRSWRMTDLLDDGTAFERAGDELANEGLYVALPPWGYHVLRVRQAEVPHVAGAPVPVSA